MTSDNTKAVKELSTKIGLVLKQQSAMNEKLDQHTKVLNNHTKQLNEVQETLEDHTGRLEALAGDVEQLKMDVTGIKDAEGMFHSRNKREIDEIKDHLGLPLIPDIPQV